MKQKIFLILTIITSILPSYIYINFIYQNIVKIIDTNHHRVLQNYIDNIISWLLSFFWLCLLLFTLRLYNWNKKMFWLFLFIPLAFWHNIFYYLFIIFYSIFPFAP